MPLRHWLIRVSFALGLIWGAPALATEQEARDYAVSIGNTALSILSVQDTDAAKQQRLEQMFVDIVDTDWIARFVLGAGWRKLDGAQRAEYLQTYRKFLIRHYTSNFKEYTEGTTFKVTKSRPIGGRDQYLVGMQILRKSNPEPIVIDYRLRQQNKAFRVIDIVVEGVSLLATQREEFASVIQRDGLPRLLELLKKKAG